MPQHIVDCELVSWIVVNEKVRPVSTYCVFSIVLVLCPSKETLRRVFIYIRGTMHSYPLCNENNAE
jgi:hypothetical protein